MIAALFIRLYDAAQAKPIATAAAGGGVGFFGWVVTWAEFFTKFCQLVAGFFGAVAAFLAVLFLLPRAIRFVRAWRARGLASADLE
jgi:predicted RND superfamily exporter protein